MKTRTGFVSNSSSSSFILITSKTNHDYAYGLLTDTEKKVIDKLIEEDTFLTVPIVSIATFSSDNYSTFSWVEEELGNDQIDYDDISNAWEHYQKIVKEKPDAIFSTSIDM